MVGGAFLAGYFKGKALGLSEVDSIRYADDVAERTQASANLTDRPPVNYGKIKTAMGQFQTFIYNEWSQIKEDMIKRGIKGEKTFQDYGEGLFGIKEERSTGYKRLLGYTIATIALSAIYDELGLPNPFKQEGAKLPGVENEMVNKVWEHLINQIPGISSVRFGGSPIVQGVVGISIVLTGDDKQKQESINKLKNIGLRLLPAGGQISKTGGTVSALTEGGEVYSKSGKTVLFQINKNDYYSVAKGLLFGKYYTNEGQKYLEEMRKKKESKKKGLGEKLGGKLGEKAGEKLD
jgi:hypothetical protein